MEREDGAKKIRQEAEESKEINKEDQELNKFLVEYELLTVEKLVFIILQILHLVALLHKNNIYYGDMKL